MSSNDICYYSLVRFLKAHQNYQSMGEICDLYFIALKTINPWVKYVICISLHFAVWEISSRIFWLETRQFVLYIPQVE